MLHAHTPARHVLPPARPTARIALVGEFVTAVVIILGGGWLTTLASLH